ncbi:UDP-N-acetylmuramoylalanyl-D-glutamyl-2,6-diaminopimelate--D-alanyl-D-alanine ligase [Rhodoblastus acidophilus]|uniref:UDP-N-acetylmuramoyl-tripeptide--D-alanyl-D-alanine ligase n=1 Tax=Candidatus Rhodoblastus alkanivorans TaxID=2954117 RepID=A0ABS9Z8P8_9HYPH|nr:UDP-N-acetylmuramoylalanyl-D-glutamyl-2,6-diaminopimelate--D-alanyl-D-alanine ligase [Candidatus Rhodoblastus alkanivorans]MCI4679522.1 UDP-N-acetylmuramoylalanyl-D-glutamyl-2,6-diaminopimelate--D-alanyl-D-alanine ligase [Candidatus Rhodoblastus alkanivorans]MCI4683967.1 UDP-N-acetylmuramoylalanyl-D-glutamyl-2,6-diaminopimelate--D-alanyl-D-alanine ligase [Candidatus Rhodoblastus alkanivorans]MDI4641286.1 UDP-N-acetylmuramoylalanyl-D-glutamyl-2,6-diaminopimelate--D-alanyl-D-alanine ligase [Rho
MSEILWSGLGLVAPLRARVLGLPPEGATGISIDTRTLLPGELFFAIKGDRSDGHDYVGAAFDRGAVAAVVDEAHADALKHLGTLYIVHDVLKALEGLGRAARKRSRARIVAVTGSVGKTSTKEMLRKVLSDAGPTHASDKSYNNHWGVPLTLARLPETARYAVFEIGMSHAGEIAALVDMVRPHVAVVTNVAPVHLEHFANVEEIAQAKAEIFSGIVKGGVAIVNRDVETFPILEAAAKASPAGYLLSFGENIAADAHLTKFDPEESFSRVSARVLRQELHFRVGAPGRHMAINALAVLLAARAVGVEFSAITASLAGVAPPQGRGARETLQRDRDDPESSFLLIDESYNANPASMRAAFQLLGAAQPSGAGRRIAVLGDMLELGPTGPDLHAALRDDLDRVNVELVFAAGPLMRHLFDALPPEKRGAWTETAAALEPLVAEALRAGDVVMVKGSNGSKLHALAAGLKSRFAAPELQEVEE